MPPPSLPLPSQRTRGTQHFKYFKYLFRKLVHKVILCRHLLLELQNNKIGLNPKRNVINMTRRKRSPSLLTSHEQLLFAKSVENRNLKEQEDIVRIVANLKCFEIFPPKIRARIAPHLNLIKIEYNRILIRQEHIPTYIYFVLTGEIIAYRMIEDKSTNRIYQNDQFIVTSGDMLGYLSLIENRRRYYSYRALTDVDCLYLDNEQFNIYLMPYIKKQIESKYLALNKYDNLSKFTKLQKEFIALFGILKEYQPMETIYYKDEGDLNYIYFIINGECMLLQYLKINKIKNMKNKYKYKLCPLDDKPNKINYSGRKEQINLIKEIKQRRSITADISNFNLDGNLNNKSFMNQTQSKIKNYYIDVGTFSTGAVFGLGEPMEERAIMAKTIVQCLLIPRFWLFSKEQNLGNIWQRLKISLESAIPAREELFKEFLNDKKWKKYKRNYIEENLNIKRKKLNSTKIDDIPLICRIVESNLENSSDDE